MNSEKLKYQNQANKFRIKTADLEKYKDQNYI